MIKARTVKRRPETLKWDRELYDSMNFVPWLIDGPVARPEAGGNQHLDAKRPSRGRPFNHTAECAAKQSDFQERLREMKMLSAHEDTPALDPGSGAVPAWPVVSETAGASSSSSGGGGIAQPMAVESDLTHTRGLKREVWMLLTWKSLMSVRSFPMLT